MSDIRKLWKLQKVSRLPQSVRKKIAEAIVKGEKINIPIYGVEFSDSTHSKYIHLSIKEAIKYAMKHGAKEFTVHKWVVPLNRCISCMRKSGNIPNFVAGTKPASSHHVDVAELVK